MILGHPKWYKKKQGTVTVTGHIPSIWAMSRLGDAFGWSLGLVSRILMRTIDEGSTLVMPPGDGVWLVMFNWSMERITYFLG